MLVGAAPRTDEGVQVHTLKCSKQREKKNININIYISIVEMLNTLK